MRTPRSFYNYSRNIVFFNIWLWEDYLLERYARHRNCNFAINFHGRCSSQIEDESLQIYCLFINHMQDIVLDEVTWVYYMLSGFSQSTKIYKYVSITACGSKCLLVISMYKFLKFSDLQHQKDQEKQKLIVEKLKPSASLLQEQKRSNPDNLYSELGSPQGHRVICVVFIRFGDIVRFGWKKKKNTLFLGGNEWRIRFIALPQHMTFFHLMPSFRPSKEQFLIFW